MPRSTLGSGGDPLIWLGLAAATLVMGVYWAPVIGFADRSLRFFTG